MEIKAYLYDSNGEDREIEYASGIRERLSEDQLLWINILKREKSLIERVIKDLKFENAPVREFLNTDERPKLDKYENYYRLFINSVSITKKSRLNRVPIDFLIGKNTVITIQDGEVDYFAEFRELEEGERHIGEMDAETFVATLLDLHIVTFFRAVELIERDVDNFDEEILTSDLDDEEFFAQMLGLRRDVSKLRKWLLPHRDVFYALARPDFERIAESESAGHFQNLNRRFESAVNAIEDLRDTVLSLFDLYATHTSHLTNDLMRRLTFATIMFGAMGVIVGALGMNFDAGFFDTRNGFWIALLGLGLFSFTLILTARFRKWI